MMNSNRLEMSDVWQVHMSDKIELTGMVLSARPVGEYDKRIVLLTRERGKISAFAKGARRQNSPILAAANPFAYGVFECYEGRNSYTCYQAQISNYFESLSLDFEKAWYGMYFLEFADYYAREGTDEQELLRLLYVTLRVLEHGRMGNRLIRYIYELRAMVINGEYPQAFTCVGCGAGEHLTGYAPEKHGMLCESCLHRLKGRKLKESTIYAIQYVISAPLEKLYSFSLSDEVQREFEELQDAFRSKMIDKPFQTLKIMETLQISG